MTRFSKHAAIVTTAFAAYAGALIALRPWYTRWGATGDEVRRSLPGDELAPNGAACNHAITIDAPASDIWKLLVQIGPSKRGEHSRPSGGTANPERFDRLCACRRERDSRATCSCKNQRDPGNVPLLRVALIKPQHYLVLEGWGEFVLEPIDPTTPRRIIRSHGTKPMGRPLLNFLFWDPAHFIMERGMLRGIKRRSERSASSSSLQSIC